MPELPEVETIRSDLQREVVGSTITAVKLYWERVVAFPSAEDFVRGLTGRRIEDIGRRGKYLLFRLDSHDVLIAHLRMTGQLIHRRASDEMENQVRAVLELDDGSQLRFADMRKFGRLWLVPSELMVVGKLGPEPLAEEFTFEVFRERLRRRKGAIKPVLLDQSVIAGIGNIYADEALFAARIHPQTRVGDLTELQLQNLYQAVRAVLASGVENRGTTVDRYRDGLGRRGGFQEKLQVFRRAGQACPVCQGRIQRIVVGGRGTFICPSCQRLAVSSQKDEFDDPDPTQPWYH